MARRRKKRRNPSAIGASDVVGFAVGLALPLVAGPFASLSALVGLAFNGIGLAVVGAGHPSYWRGSLLGNAACLAATELVLPALNVPVPSLAAPAPLAKGSP